MKKLFAIMLALVALPAFAQTAVESVDEWTFSGGAGSGNGTVIIPGTGTAPALAAVTIGFQYGQLGDTPGLSFIKEYGQNSLSGRYVLSHNVTAIPTQPVLYTTTPVIEMSTQTTTYTDPAGNVLLSVSVYVTPASANGTFVTYGVNGQPIDPATNAEIVSCNTTYQDNSMPNPDGSTLDVLNTSYQACAPNGWYYNSKSANTPLYQDVAPAVDVSGNAVVFIHSLTGQARNNFTPECCQVDNWDLYTVVVNADGTTTQTLGATLPFATYNIENPLVESCQAAGCKVSGGTYFYVHSTLPVIAPPPPPPPPCMDDCGGDSRVRRH
jgi:hypothetical protein